MTAIDDWIAELRRFRGSANVAPLFADVDTVVAFLEAINGVSGSILSAGSYTPTLVNGANVAASTSHVCVFMRMSNVCIVFGQINIDPTAGAVATDLNISLPIASNFAGNTDEGGGVALRQAIGATQAIPGRIFTDNTNDQMTLAFLNDASLVNAFWFFGFGYLIVP